MTTRQFGRRSLLMGAVAAPLSLGVATRITQAQDEINPLAPAGAVFRMISSESGYTMPEAIPSGIVTLTLDNAGSRAHAGQLLQLSDDVSLADIVKAQQAGTLATLDLGALSGGPGHTVPGGQTTVAQNLAAGNYLVIDTVVNENGVPQFVEGIVTPFAVVDSGQESATPEAEIEVTLVDFSFEGLPDQISTGEHVWKVTSTGTEAHELGFRKLDDGVTADELIAMLTAEAESTPAATPSAGSMSMLANLPVTPAGGIQAMEPDMSGWMVVDLEAGDYVALSVVPSAANGGKLQAQVGMIQALTVVDA